MGTITLQNLSVKQNKKNNKVIIKAGGASTNTWDAYGKRCYENYEQEYETAIEAVISLVNWVFETRRGAGTDKIVAMFDYCDVEFPKYENDLTAIITDTMAEELLKAYKEVVKKNRIIYVSEYPLSKKRISIYGAHVEYAYSENYAKVMTYADYVAVKTAFHDYKVSQKKVVKTSKAVA